ncbi:MAG: cation:proton antiporter [Spirochaetaceae bacterium]|nr:cation:proton antiporter [Spirochaetaceae bacterium]
MDVFIYTFLLLGSATYMGHLLSRIKMPQIIGEILGGILVGPVLLLILSLVFAKEKPEIIRYFSHEHASLMMQSIIDFSAVFIMLGAGLEIDIRDLLKAGKASFLTAVFGVIVPFLLGVYVGQNLLHLSLIGSLYIATSLSITAVALSVATLIQIGKLSTQVGMTIVGAAVVDDILGIIVLSVLTSLHSGNNVEISSLVFIFVKAFLFVGLSIWLGPVAGKFIFKKIEHLGLNERLSIILIWVFIFSMLAHFVKLHLMIGAFLGGLTIREYLRSNEVESIERWIWGFFAPLFFAWTGFSVTLSGGSLGMSLIYITSAAFIGKIFGGAIGAFLGGIKFKHSIIVGIGMNGRAAVELVIANIALLNGIISREIYSAIVFMAIITAISTPILLKISAEKLKL